MFRRSWTSLSSKKKQYECSINYTRKSRENSLILGFWKFLTFFELFFSSLFASWFIVLADQEPGTPELQIYEIPLDSLGQQRVYIGTKRIAPKSDDHKERMQVAKFTKNRKHRRKHREDFRVNTLPATAGRRDHIYSSVNDEVNSALSEGMIISVAVYSI